MTDSGRSKIKYFGEGAGPSSFGRQQRLSEITIEQKNLGAWARFGGPLRPGPSLKPPLTTERVQLTVCRISGVQSGISC